MGGTRQLPLSPPRVLAVAHSNGAADVLLAALLRIGIPAVRVGRPASVAPSVRPRTIVALAERHPEVTALRAMAQNASLPGHERSAATADLRTVREEVSNVILSNAQVVVASCVGAHQLLTEGGGAIDLSPSTTSASSRSSSSSEITCPSFPLVVLDEGSQTTEPALVCALAAARAEQLVIVGDTKQLPPTVATGCTELRKALGTSPMARLEALGMGQKTLTVQYRMPPELLLHPSAYFYDSLVTCAPNRAASYPPKGFDWPGGRPLCFVQVGTDSEVSHPSGGRSNPTEARLVAALVQVILSAEDIAPNRIAVLAPYARQVDLLRRILPRKCRVGTIDSFQGQETDLVVFSATRSNLVGDLGFLQDPRRLCVALTRARRGLILVGDLKTLRSSHHWAALAESCESRGCIVHPDLSELRRTV